MDKLEQIFTRQQTFIHSIGRNPVLLNLYDESGFLIRDGDEEKIKLILQRIDEYATAIMMEGSELKDWTPWKHWSENAGNKAVTKNNMLSPDHIHQMRIEVADILCFLINVSLWLGMTPDTLNEIHANKVLVNHNRQEGGSY